MKKKVLFMIISMRVGGTEKALLNMIDKMPEEKFDITILMLERRGGFLNEIPERVKVEYLKEYQSLKRILNDSPFKSAASLINTGKIIEGLMFTFFHVLSSCLKDRTIFYKYIFRSVPDCKTNYDIAIAYAGPMDFISYYIAKKVHAKKKIQWIHFDITQIGFDKYFAAKVYKKFDKVFTVSQEGRGKFISVVPSLEKQTEVFPNVIVPELLLKQAEQGRGFEDDFTGVRILTVGRLSKEKGQDLTIPVLAKLKDNKLNVRWYCIGEGSARREYEEMIKKYGMEKDFILLGATSNPYPFMKQCNIYVQPSRHEGHCITLAEAKCFGNPIICTNFTGANEQLVDYDGGFIVKKEEMYPTIKDLVSNHICKQSTEIASN